jgi:hypothetical protein
VPSTYPVKYALPADGESEGGRNASEGGVVPNPRNARRNRLRKAIAGVLTGLFGSGPDTPPEPPIPPPPQVSTAITYFQQDDHRAMQQPGAAAGEAGRISDPKLSDVSNVPESGSHTIEETTLDPLLRIMGPHLSLGETSVVVMATSAVTLLLGKITDALVDKAVDEAIEALRQFVRDHFRKKRKASAKLDELDSAHTLPPSDRSELERELVELIATEAEQDDEFRHRLDELINRAQQKRFEALIARADAEAGQDIDFRYQLYESIHRAEVKRMEDVFVRAADPSPPTKRGRRGRFSGRLNPFK